MAIYDHAGNRYETVEEMQQAQRIFASIYASVPANEVVEIEAEDVSPVESEDYSLEEVKPKKRARKEA